MVMVFKCTKRDIIQFKIEKIKFFEVHKLELRYVVNKCHGRIIALSQREP